MPSTYVRDNFWEWKDDKLVSDGKIDEIRKKDLRINLRDFPTCALLLHFLKWNYGWSKNRIIGEALVDFLNENMGFMTLPEDYFKDLFNAKRPLDYLEVYVYCENCDEETIQVLKGFIHESEKDAFKCRQCGEIQLLKKVQENTTAYFNPQLLTKRKERSDKDSENAEKVE